MNSTNPKNEKKDDYRNHYDKFEPADVVREREWKELIAKIRELEDQE